MASARPTENQIAILRNHHGARGPCKVDARSAPLVKRGWLREDGVPTPSGLSELAYADARDERIAKERARKEEDTKIVRSGKCPTCGAALKRNLALTGWWQCEQFGAVGFRKDGSKPSCSWQTFID